MRSSDGDSAFLRFLLSSAIGSLQFGDALAAIHARLVASSTIEVA
jgi:hypothetical protein